MKSTLRSIDDENAKISLYCKMDAKITQELKEAYDKMKAKEERKKTVRKYVKLPFIRLIFEDGKYAGWYRPKHNKSLIKEN